MRHLKITSSFLLFLSLSAAAPLPTSHDGADSLFDRRATPTPARLKERVPDGKLATRSPEMILVNRDDKSDDGNEWGLGGNDRLRRDGTEWAKQNGNDIASSDDGNEWGFDGFVPIKQ